MPPAGQRDVPGTEEKMRKSAGFSGFIAWEILTEEPRWRKLKGLAQGRTSRLARHRAGLDPGCPSPAALGQQLPRKHEQSPVSSPRDTPCAVLLPPHPRPSPRSRPSGEAGGRRGPRPSSRSARATACKPPGSPPQPPPPPRSPRGAGWEPRRPHPSRPPPRLFRVPAARSRPAPPAWPSPREKTAPGRQRANPQTPTEPRTHSHSAAGTRSAPQPRPWRTWRPSAGLC